MLQRFHQNRNQVFLKRQYNEKAQRYCKITPEMKKHLLSPKCLQEFQSLTLEDRVERIEDRFGVKIHSSSLYRFYSRHGVSNQATSYQIKHKQTLQRADQRLAWVVRLAQVYRYKPNLLCYMDETSLNSWIFKKKTYRKRKDGTRIVVPERKLSGATIIGCIGLFLPDFFFHQIVERTTA